MSETHGFIGADQLRAVKAATAYPDLVGRYAQVKKAGAEFAACCPFHQERTPSFTMYEGDAGWAAKCHGCGWSGDVVAFVMAKEGLDFQPAVEHLAGLAGISLTYTRQRVDAGPSRVKILAALEAADRFFISKLTPRAMEYLESRGFTRDTIQAWGFGWAPGRGELCQTLEAAGHEPEVIKAAGLAVDGDRGRRDFFWHRITLPIRDRSGHVRGFTARVLPEDEAAAKAEGRTVPKYINSPEGVVYRKAEILFGWDKSRQEISLTSSAVLVEGPWDVVAAAQLGRRDVVACGGTAFTAEQAAALRPMLASGGLTFLFDGGTDKAGPMAAAKSLGIAWAAGLDVAVAQLVDAKDPGDLLTRPDGARVLDTAVDAAPPGLTWIMDRIIRAVPSLEAAAQDPGRMLRLVDQVLDHVAQHQDPEWRSLAVVAIAQRMALPVKLIRDRLASRLKSDPTPEHAEKSAGSGSASGELTAPQPVSGGRQAILGKLATEFLTRAKVRSDAIGCLMDPATGKPATFGPDDLALMFWDEVSDRFDRGIGLDIARNVLRLWILRDSRARRAEIIGRMIGKPANPAGSEEIRRLVQVFCGPDASPEDRAVYHRILLHFIWQVKRNACGLPVVYQIMPVLVGPQGTGKSTLLRLLCEPWAELASPVTGATLADARESPILEKCLIGVVDEMEGMSRQDSNSIKNTITAANKIYRPLSTNFHQRLNKLMTMIGTSNDSLAYVLTDHTGNRRFFEIPSPVVVLVQDLEKFNWNAMWEAVTEHDAPPALGDIEAIKSRQADCAPRTSVAAWFASDRFDELVMPDPHGVPDDHGRLRPLVIPPYDHAKGISLETLFNRYRHWSEQQGVRLTVTEHKAFGKYIAPLGIHRRNKAGTRADRAWMYRLPDDLPAEHPAIGKVSIRRAPAPRTPEEHEAKEAAALSAFLDQRENPETPSTDAKVDGF